MELNRSKLYKETGELRNKTKTQLFNMFVEAQRKALVYLDCHDGSFEMACCYNGRDAIIDEWKERGYDIKELFKDDIG